MSTGTELAGRLALVTGAGRGIGEAVVAALVEQGARVLATDLAFENVTALADKYGEQVTARPLDVTDAAAVEALVAEAERTLGPLDIAVNVAGVLRSSDVVDLTDEDWAATFAVNTNGVFHVSRSVARRMAGAAAAASSPSPRMRPVSPAPAWPPMPPRRPRP